MVVMSGPTGEWGVACGVDELVDVKATDRLVPIIFGTVVLITVGDVIPDRCVRLDRVAANRAETGIRSESRAALRAHGGVRR